MHPALCLPLILDESRMTQIFVILDESIIVMFDASLFIVVFGDSIVVMLDDSLYRPRAVRRSRPGRLLD